MPWVKLDDMFPDHPKVVSAGPVAGWLYVCGLCYCGRYLTDGYIPLHQVKKLADVDDVDELVTRLVEAQLWELCEDGYMVHDYLVYNPSRAQVMAARAATSRRQDTWRLAHRQSDGTYRQQNAVSDAVSSNRPVPVPVPVPVPDPIPQEQGTSATQTRSAKRREHAPAPPAVEVYRESMHRYPDKAQFDKIADIVGNDDERLALWRAITETWRDRGWNRQNMVGMLECFRKGEVPGRNDGRDSPMTEPRGFAGIRAMEAADERRGV